VAVTFDELLERLNGVRKFSADRAKAKCPAHADKRASLSIRAIGDGTILLHCFALCEPLAICRALGIGFRDLFPANRIRRVEYRERPRLSSADALAALADDAYLIAIVGADMLQHREIEHATWSLLADAVKRVTAARAVCCAPDAGGRRAT
jgi:hypothetical protein